MDGQISIDELLTEVKPREKVEIPKALYETTNVYRIPDDVWENRCRLCVHKNAEENVPVPRELVYRPQYAEVIPCRIMTVASMNGVTGECMSFTPRIDVGGICRSCVHTSYFHDGYCRKDGHAPKRQVYRGQDWGQEYYRESLRHWP